jgi:hypothetical protein
MFGLFSHRQSNRVQDLDDDLDLFVPIETLDHQEPVLTDAMASSMAPTILAEVAPTLGALAHVLTLAAEAGDLLQPRPAPQAINDAARAYLQQPQRTRFGERAGVWVKVQRPRRAIEPAIPTTVIPVPVIARRPTLRPRWA